MVDTVAWLQLWGCRMKTLTAADLALASGESLRVCQLALEGYSSAADLVENEAGAFDYRGGRVDPPGELLRIRDLVARTITYAERRLDAFREAPESYPGTRRFVLHSLSGLLLPCGAIDDLGSLPERERMERFRLIRENLPLPERTPEEARKDEARHARAERFRTRAVALRSEYASAVTRPDPLRVAETFNPAPVPTWSALPSDPAALSEREWRDALYPRFGSLGQMLAASKSRMIWSNRCVFNGRMAFADDPEAERGGFWYGDFWLFPVPERPDPRRGAADVARHYGRAVTAYYESHGPVWTIHPDGRFEWSEQGRRQAEYLGQRLEESGWPTFGEWPLYPSEFPVGSGR